MDAFSPEQYLGTGSEELSRQAYGLLRRRHGGTLAMATGGCARYAFCTDVAYCLDRRGFPLIHYSSPNPHHHLILHNTTMTLRLPHVIDADGNEQSILILTGMLALVDPGDHDSLDRHYRYYQQSIENYTRGADRLYRLVPEGACFELFSGRRMDLDLDALVVRNPLTGREEESLVRQLNALTECRAARVAGVDGAGLDRKSGPDWVFQPFPEPLFDKETVTRAAIQRIRDGLVTTS